MFTHTLGRFAKSSLFGIARARDARMVMIIYDIPYVTM